MSIPVNRLKLLAFVFGAAVGGLHGSDLRHDRDGGVPGRLRRRPADHDLRDRDPRRVREPRGHRRRRRSSSAAFPSCCARPANARRLFYGAILIAILVKLRPWRLLAAELGGLLALGFAIHAIADAAYPRLVDGEAIGSGRFARGARSLDALPGESREDRGLRLHPPHRRDRRLSTAEPALASLRCLRRSYISSCSSGKTSCSCRSAGRRG